MHVIIVFWKDERIHIIGKINLTNDMVIWKYVLCKLNK